MAEHDRSGGAMRPFIYTIILMFALLLSTAAAAETDEDGGEQVCSPLISQATINEVHGPQNNDGSFIEIKLLNQDISPTEYKSWTLSYCSSDAEDPDGTNNCQTVSFGGNAIGDDNLPWIVIPVSNSVYIDFAQANSSGMEIRLNDAQDRAIDYFSVDGYSSELDVSCDFRFDTKYGSIASNVKTLRRSPDGTGDWGEAGPGGSGATTAGGSNDNFAEGDPRLDVSNISVSAGDTAVFTLRLLDSKGNELTLQEEDPNVEIQYTTVDGESEEGATSPEDYEETAGVATIAAGSSTASVSVPTQSTAEDGSFFYLLIESAEQDNGDPVAVLNNFATARITAPGPEASLEYIELSYAPQALTCTSADITFRACATENCDTLYEDPVELTAVAEVGGQWVGDANVQFTGEITRQLVRTVASTLTLGASNVSPAPEGDPPLRCNGGQDCTLEFVSTALLLTDENGFPISLTTATAGNALDNLFLSAIETNEENGACQAAIEDEERLVRWAAVTADPVAPNGYEVLVNNNPITTQTATDPLQFTDLTLAFNEHGRTTNPLSVRYDDVGFLRLNAETEVAVADETRTLKLIDMSTNTATTALSNPGVVYLVRPHGLRIVEINCSIAADGDCFPNSQALAVDSVHQNPGASDAEGTPFAYAGAEFNILLEATNAQDLITPNFGNEEDASSIGLLIEHSLDNPAPNTTYSDGLTLTINNLAAADGQATAVATWPETGAIKVLAHLENYFTWSGTVSTEEATIGRFIPFEYGIEWLSASLQPPAPQPDYVYQSQSFGWMLAPAVELTPHAFRTDPEVTLSGAPTRFFDFATFNPAAPEDYSLSRPTDALAGGALSYDAETNLLSAGDNAWQRKMEFAYTPLTITKVLTEPDTDQAPEQITLNLGYAASAFSDDDGVCYRNVAGSCIGLERDIGSTLELIYGRLTFTASQGPIDRPLGLPMQIQQWTLESEFKRSPTAYNDAQGISADQFIINGLNGYESDLQTIDPQPFTDDGSSTVELAKPDGPGEAGRAQVYAETVPVFLRFPWPHGSPAPSSPEDLVGPRAIASFGTYEGRPPVLFMLPQGR